MDIIAIVLFFMKKYKAALILSIIGLFLVLILWGSDVLDSSISLLTSIIYVSVIIGSSVKLANGNNNEESEDKNVESNLENDLLQLNDLRDKGLITDSEYQEKRKDILDKY